MTSLPPTWSTDEDLRGAREHFAAAIPGWRRPVAYGVARVDEGGLVWGHRNEPGGRHLLPGVVLATVCGHSSGTATYPLSAGQLRRAVELLTPAEAALHWDHPNLWSWRGLLEGGPDARFVAVLVADVDDPPVDEHDAAFRGAWSD